MGSALTEIDAVDVGQGNQPLIVLADPEGNGLCLLRAQVG